MNRLKSVASLCNHIFLFGIIVLAGGLINTSYAQIPAAKQRLETINGNQYLLTSRLKKILIGSFYYNFNHTIGTPNLDSTLKRIGRAESPPWTVDIDGNGNDITVAKLAGYQVFFANYISSWASATGFPTANRTAVQSFVEDSGRGVFIMHSSGDSRTGGNWPWYYSTAHPVNYIGESSRTTVSAPIFIPTTGRTNPIMEGIGFGAGGTSDTFNVSQGEFHQFAHIITAVVPNANSPTLNLLLDMNGAQCKLGGSGTNCGVATATYNYSIPGGYPAAWTFPDKKGNIGYFMEGHDSITMQSMTVPVWDKFFKQFMYWMAGYDTVLVTSIHKSNLDFSLDPSGVTFHPGEIGVLITRPGSHIVDLYNMAGRTVKEIRGNHVPVDYNLTEELKGSQSGVYVMRVSVAGQVKSRRFFLR